MASLILSILVYELELRVEDDLVGVNKQLLWMAARYFFPKFWKARRYRSR